MPNRCDVADAECEIACNTQCWRCGLPVCKGCSSVVAKYLDHGKKRICNNCMREGIRHSEAWAVSTIEVPAPPVGATLSSAIRAQWEQDRETLYTRALAKRGA